MRLTFFTDYGLRVLMRMAGEPDRAFSTSQLAKEFQVSRNHLAKVFSALSSIGVIKTRRGGGGGARLALPADRIRIGDIVRQLEAGHTLVECFAETGNRCTLTPGCRLKTKLANAEAAFMAELDNHTLADCAYPPTFPSGQ